MARETWFFTLDDTHHVVELSHNFFSGRTDIVIDHEVYEDTPRFGVSYPGLRYEYPFDIGDHTCAVSVQANLLTYDYDLIIDGVSRTTGRTPQQLRAFPAWAIVFMFVCCIPAILTLGGAVPVALAFTGTGNCYITARDPNKTLATRLIGCVASVFVCWGLYALSLIFFIDGLATSFAVFITFFTFFAQLILTINSHPPYWRSKIGYNIGRIAAGLLAILLVFEVVSYIVSPKRIAYLDVQILGRPVSIIGANPDRPNVNPTVAPLPTPTPRPTPTPHPLLTFPDYPQQNVILQHEGTDLPATLASWNCFNGVPHAPRSITFRAGQRYQAFITTNTPDNALYFYGTRPEETKIQTFDQTRNMYLICAGSLGNTEGYAVLILMPPFADPVFLQFMQDAFNVDRQETGTVVIIIKGTFSAAL